MTIVSISHLSPVLATHYALSALARIWTRKGLEVRVGRTYDESAAVCILHHDRTRVDSAPAAPPGAAHLNGGVRDISKRLISTLAIERHDRWTGPVIIKTNANHFGIVDPPDAPQSLATRARIKLRPVSWRWARTLPEKDYPILNSVEDVPGWVWSDPALIVEKFLPERTDDGLYALRGWMFFGAKSYGYRLFSTHPLVKVGTMVRHEYLEETPDELAALRSRLKFDFGKFDYVVHDGKAIVLDANKTPSFGDDSDEETPRVRMLAEGIDAYLS